MSFKQSSRIFQITFACGILTLPFLERKISADEPGNQSILFSTWADLDARLASVTHGDTRIESFKKSSLFCDISSSSNANLWHSMISQSSRPLVAIAGFHCLKENNSKGYMLSGLKIICESDRPLMPIYNPIRECASVDGFGPDYALSVYSFMARGNYDLGKMTVACAIIPKAVLLAWLRSDFLQRVPVDYVAVVLEQILNDNAEGSLDDEELRKLLDVLSQCPGYSRLIYVTYYNPDNNRKYLTAFRSVLADSSVSDLQIASLGIRKKEFIRENQESLLNGITEQHRDIIKRILQKK